MHPGRAATLLADAMVRLQVPVVIKEALDVYGYPSTFGWNYTSYLAGGVDLFPSQNAAIVDILIDAGVVIMGSFPIENYENNWI